MSKEAVSEEAVSEEAVSEEAVSESERIVAGTFSSQRLVWTLLLAALIAAGAYLQIPVGPVPISMQTAVVLLVGFVLGPVGGAVCALVYLSAGALGLPVYSGGSSGIERLASPAGGFLLGFPIAAAIAGLAVRDRSQQLSWRSGIVWGALASAALFLIGVPWLKFAVDTDWADAVEVGMLPFLPGAVFKLVLAIVTYRLLFRRGLLPD